MCWHVATGAQFTYQDTGIFARLCPRRAPAAVQAVGAAAERRGGRVGCCSAAYCSSVWGNIGLGLLFIIIAVPCFVIALLYSLGMALLLFCFLLANPDPICCEQGPPCAGNQRRLTLGERCHRAWCWCCIFAGGGVMAAGAAPVDVLRGR